MWYIFLIMKMRHAWLAVCMWCVLWGQETSKNQHSPASTASNHASDPAQIVPPPSTVVNPSVAAPQSQPPAANAQQQTQTEPTIWLLRPEWVIVWVTFVYTVLTWRTLRAIKRQADLMAEQLKDARKNSTDSAKTTQATLAAIQRQASLMERQINISINKQRAKIFVDLVPKNWAFLKEGYQRKMEKIGDWDYADELDEFHIVLRNEGESESYNTVAQGEVTVTRKEDNAVLVSRVFERVLSIMRPGKSQDEFGVDFFPPLEDGILESIFNGLATLRFSGRITYEDALEPEKTHLTLFCFEWQADQELIDYGDGDSGWVDQSGWETRPPELNRFT